MTKRNPCKDMIGQNITVGSWVAFNPPYTQGVMIGKVLSYTAKTVQLEYQVGANGLIGNGDMREITRRSATVVNITGQISGHKENYPEMYL